MSGKAFGEQFAIIPDSILEAPISANAFRLFAILQRHSDVLGHCYPGLNRLSEMMGCSADTVRRAKRELIASGLITCQERFDDLGRRTTDDIFLHPPGRESATYEGGKAATLNSKAVELEPDELDLHAGARDVAGATPGTPTPIWANRKLWLDDKGRWFVADEPDEAAQ